MHKIRVMIVDDHELYRDGVRGVLEATADIEIIGEADTGEAALTLAATTQPDVIVLDVQMPGMDGITATRAIRERCPQTQVILLTQFDEKLVPGMQAGAAGYMIKNTLRTQVVEAIRSVASGNAYLHPNVHNKVVEMLRRTEIRLSENEQQVLRLMVEGRTNKAIAIELGYGQTWVKELIASILTKLEVTHRAGAIAKAVQLKLI